MPIDMRKNWPIEYFGTKLKLLSCNPVLGPKSFENYKKGLLDTWPHLYEDKSDSELRKKHLDYEEHKKKFLSLCKPGEVVFTRPFRSKSKQNRLFIYQKESISSDYDYELVLVSIRKLPFLKEISVECEVYQNTRVYHNTPGQYHTGQIHTGTFSIKFNKNNQLEFSLYGTKGTLAKGERATFRVI